MLVFLFTNVTIRCFDHTRGVLAGINYSIDGLLAMRSYCGISFYIFS